MLSKHRPGMTNNIVSAMTPNGLNDAQNKLIKIITTTVPERFQEPTNNDTNDRTSKRDSETRSITENLHK